jgi:hypothetical protein
MNRKEMIKRRKACCCALKIEQGIQRPCNLISFLIPSDRQWRKRCTEKTPE